MRALGHTCKLSWTQVAASRRCPCRRISTRRSPSMSYKFGPTVTQQPSGGKHTATVIFLHGLGDTGNGIAPIGQALVDGAPQLSHVKFLFPTAPQRPVTMNGSAVMPGNLLLMLSLCQ